MVPLGCEKSHGQNELEPFPFPGGKQQFKMPAPSKGNKAEQILSFRYSSLNSSVGREVEP